MSPGDSPIRLPIRQHTNVTLRPQAGLSLVETLITLLSTSVGLLAVAALHLVTTANYQDATQRLQATNLAVTMLEQIRAHPADFRNGRYDLRFSDQIDGSAIADQQMLQWRHAIAKELSAHGTFQTESAISTDPKTSSITITVRWRKLQREPDVNAASRQVVLESHL